MAPKITIHLDSEQTRKLESVFKIGIIHQLHKEKMLTNDQLNKLTKKIM